MVSGDINFQVKIYLLIIVCEKNKNLTTKIINTILIANRGEIASRIIRTCKKMGIRSIAVFSKADRKMPFVKDADMAVFIGESEPIKSYLDQEKIITVAKKYGADAIHPGYGFLSENAGFAKYCATENIIFIGPNVKAIEAMGSKSAAKILMKKHKVPIIPGYQGKDQSLKKLIEEAKKMGFPVLLKATAGGGGKGMRIVNQENEIEDAVKAAQREAKSAFGDDELIIEKYISKGRHIEFQIFGDQHKNVVHILERECSIQRRYQKVIEESPSPIMTDALRQKMGESAVAAAKALQYDNAGTVEFIYDDQSGEYYFLEVNTRLQVEHPVTEEITGLDLVQMQIESAQGMPIRVTQTDISGKGYAIEVRLYAEDAANNFLPVSGMISQFKVPKVEGLRVESAITSGSEISIFYDPMIAKLIVWDENRLSALRKMRFVLSNLVCLGMTTNQEFLLTLIENDLFSQGKYDTHFIQKNFDKKALTQKSKTAIHQALIATTLYHQSIRRAQQRLLRSISSGWRNNFYEHQKAIYLLDNEEQEIRYRYQKGGFEVLIEEQKYHAKIINFNKTKIVFELDGVQLTFQLSQNKNQIFTHNEQAGNLAFQLKDKLQSKESKKEKGAYISPMPSQVVEVLVKKGNDVKTGETLIILSSMKMENRICAEEDGKVEDIYVVANTNIEAGQLLIKIV